MNDGSFPPRPWTVLLLGGASGTGKTMVSYRLARHFGVGITEVDDFQVVLETMTTPEQQPIIHYWSTHAEAANLPAERIVEQIIAIGGVMAPALAAVIANHIETSTPLVLEGDFILPALAARPMFGEYAAAGQVRAVFLVEEDEAQIAANYLAREPDNGPQAGRAHISWLYGQWLRGECERLGIPVLPARPWETVLERVAAVVR
jgi:2-phosphoglycerate kinase